jgi:hypothetical protein
MGRDQDLSFTLGGGEITSETLGCYNDYTLLKKL